MWKTEQQSTQIHECIFRVNIQHADLHIRFPCTLFVSWRTSSNKLLARTNNDNVVIENNQAVFGEGLEICSFLRYDKTNDVYSKKETTLGVYLISKRKPDEEKLVGRVNVDLADVINNATFTLSESHSLSFCSVAGGSLKFSISVISKEKTDKPEEQIQADSFSVVQLPDKANWSVSSGQNQDAFLFKKEERDMQNERYRSSHASEKAFNTPKSEKKIQSQVKEMDEKISKLETQNSLLKNQNKKLIEMINKNNQDLEFVRKELTRAEQNIKIAEKKVQEFELRKVSQPIEQPKEDFAIQLQNELNAEIQYLKSKIFELEEEYQQSEQIRLQLESQTLQIKFELSELKTEKQVYDKLLLAKDEQLQKLAQWNSQAKQKLVELKYEEEVQKKAEKEQLVEQKLQKINEISPFMYEEQINMLKNQINALEQEAKFYENTKQQLNELTDAYNLIVHQKNELEEQIVSIEREKPKFEQMNVIEENKFEGEVNSELAQLQQQKTQLQSQVADLQNAKQALTERQSELQAENGFLQEQLQLLNKNLKQRQEDLFSTQDVLSQKSLHADALQKYLEERGQQNDQIKQQLQRYKSSYGEAQNIIKELEQKLNQANKQEMELAVSQLNEKISFIEELNRQLLERTQSLQKQKQKASQEIHILEHQLLQKQQENEKKAQETVGLGSEKEKTINQEQIQKFAERERKLKENIKILEEESKKIYEIMIQKEQNQDLHSQLLEQKGKQIDTLINQSHLLKVKNERNEQQILGLKKQLYEVKNENVRLSLIQKNEPTDDLQANFIKYKKLFQVSSERIQELQRDFVEKQEQYNKEKQSLYEKMQQTALERKKIQEKKNEHIQKEKAENKKEKTQLYEKITILERRIEQLEKNLLHLEDEKNELKIENNVLVKENQLLKIQNLNLLDEVKLMNENKTIKVIQEDKNAKPQQEQEKPENIEKAYNENQKLTKENEILQNQLSQLQKNIHKLEEQLSSVQHREVQEGKEQQDEKSAKKILAASELTEICENLHGLLIERVEKDKSQSLLQLLLNKNTVLEESLLKISEDRGVIQETARKLSMQFQRIKSNIVKAKGEFSEKKIYLDSLKPCEGIIKDLINLAQTLSQQPLELQNI